MLTNEISPSSQETFLLNSPNKKSDQLKTTQLLELTANKEQNPTKKELILLQKVKLLEKQNTHLKALVQQLQQKNETNAQIIQPYHKNRKLMLLN